MSVQLKIYKSVANLPVLDRGYPKLERFLAMPTQRETVGGRGWYTVRKSDGEFL